MNAVRKWVMVVGGCIATGCFLYVLFRTDNHRFDGPKHIELVWDNQIPVERVTQATTVAGALEEIGWPRTPEDKIWPPGDTVLRSGMRILVQEQRLVRVTVGGETEELMVTGLRVQDILDEQGIILDPLDLITPSLETTLGSGESIEVIRVTVNEESEEETIAFEKKTVEDGSLSWRVKKVTQQGEQGTKKNTYRISRHNDTVVKKELLASETLKEPTAEITTVGTKVEVGKKHTGQASWYAHTGTLSAANPWLPLGSYVRVTNTANGKSVIVRINDRGPFGAGRIIDLDKVAFQKIAPLGAGVASVIMEEITN